ncbi:MAG: LamG-like jellyroll fold domain-containing protein [Luteolibacter sp.]
MNKIYLLAATILAAFNVQAGSIPLTNGDFEATTANYFGGFDPTPDTTPGWSDYGTVADGGVENNGWWGTYKSGRSAFIANGTGAYNTSGHTIQDGEVFTVGFVGKQGWSGPTQITITLFYNTPGTPSTPLNVIGTFTQDLTGTWTQYYSGEIAATAESVGGTLGVIIEKTGAGVMAFDEVTLSGIVPTPTATFTLQPPASVSKFVDESLTLSAVAISNDPITFQWQKSTDGGTTWADVEGETGTSYTLFPSYAENGAKFRVNATNTSGTVASTVTTLTVSYPAPTVTKGLVSHTVVTGTGDVTFTAEATGRGALTFQWSKNGVLIPEASGSLTVSALTVADTATYTLVIADDAATTEWSLPATTVTLTAQLTVVDPAATTVAYYRFEEGVDAAPLASAADSEGTNTMTGVGAPNFTTYSSIVPAATVPKTGASNTLASSFPAGSFNALVAPINGTLATTTFTDFTIECYVQFKDLDAWQTMVGRDDSGSPGQGTSSSNLFDLQKLGNNIGDNSNRIRASFNTATDTMLEVVGTLAPVVGQWYHVAAVGDSVAGTCTLYIDGISVGSVTGFPGLRVPTAGSTTPWTIGRGQYGGNSTDYVHGSIDEVRFSRVALPVSKFLLSPADPSPFTTWINAYTALSDKTAGGDPDHDGMTNDQEFAFGLNPSSGASVNPIIALPNKATGVFRYTRLNPAVSGRTYTVKTSTTMTGWTTDAGAGQVVTATNGDVQTVTVTLSGALLSQPKLFVRVSAE